MNALATKSSADSEAGRKRSSASPVRLQPAAIQSQPVFQPAIQRKANCACGGGCPGCSDDSENLNIQPKLAINQPGDQYEQEADRVADQVLAMPGHREVSGTSPSIQRYTAQANGQTDAVPPSVGDALAGSGRPLDPALRQDMEQRFGHDFSQVRVHTSAVAEQSARDVNANAYTAGHNIVFDGGQFAPGTQDGRRLIAHELTHVVQQSGGKGSRTVKGSSAHAALPSASASPSGVIQREVNPKRIADKEEVLTRIKEIVDAHGNGNKPAEANLIRLAHLGSGFSPGASKEELLNRFVYTCHCGWVDMGHFFISAATAYAVGYQRRRLEVRVGGIPHTIDELLMGGSNRLSTVLDLLLKTVPDIESKQVLSDVRKLLKSGEPRDIALVFGYWMEFVQQIAKLISDPGRNLPDPLKEQLADVLAEYKSLLASVAPEKLKETIEGSARSAFTMEDLPSDCYGAAMGQDVWKQTDGAKRDLPPIYGLMQNFFKECGAVFPEPHSKTRCEMMAETTPGSCKMEGNEDIWPLDLGEPARYGSTKARLLKSAKELCGDAPAVVPCRSGTGGAGSPLPAAVVDVSDKGVTVFLPEDIPLHQPRERAYFGGDISFEGRPERFDRKDPLILSGGSFVRVTPRGNVIAHATFGGVPGLGEVETGLHLDPGIGPYGVHGGLGLRGRIDVQADGILQFQVHGKMDIDLSDLLEGLAGPELEDLKAVFQSEAFTKLVKQLLSNDIKAREFMKEVKALLKQKFPQGFEGVVRTVIWRLENMEALALATRLEAEGTVSIGGIPISGFIAHKSFGLSPLLGFEGGVVLSELAKGRTIVGAKAWVYGQDILQAQVTAGIDPVGRKAIVDLHAVNKTLTGNKLTLDVKYQINPSGDQQFLVLFGGEHNIWGSKGPGVK